MSRPITTFHAASLHLATLLTLGCLGLAGTTALAQESTTVPVEPTTKQVTVDGERKVIVNEDGSITVMTDVTGTGENGTGTATVTHDVNVTKTEDGRTWTRDTSITNERGGTLQSTTTGSGSKTGDGTGTWTSNTDGTVTGAGGKSIDYQTQRSGSWERVDDSTVNFNRDAETVRSDGVTGNRSTTGSTTRAEDGRTWESTTSGSNSKGANWTAETDGNITRNGDGTATVDVDRTIMTKSGDTITIEKDGTFTRDEDGKGGSYQGTRTVTKTDVDGDGKVGSRPEKAVDAERQALTTSQQASGTSAQGNSEAAAQRKARTEEAQKNRQEKRDTAQDNRQNKREGAQENRQNNRSERPKRERKQRD